MRWLVAYEYLLLFPLLVVEGPIVTVLAGLLASVGRLDLGWCYVIAVTADLTGDTLYYLLGSRCMRWPAVRRWLRLGEDSTPFATVRRQFDRHSGKTLVLAKLTHGAGGIALVAAGAVGMPYRPFLGWNLAGTLVKSLALLLLGFYFGRAYRAVDGYLGWFALTTVALALLVGLGLLARCAWRRAGTRA